MNEQDELDFLVKYGGLSRRKAQFVLGIESGRIQGDIQEAASASASGRTPTTRWERISASFDTGEIINLDRLLSNKCVYAHDESSNYDHFSLEQDTFEQISSSLTTSYREYNFPELSYA